MRGRGEQWGGVLFIESPLPLLYARAGTFRRAAFSPIVCRSTGGVERCRTDALVRHSIDRLKGRLAGTQFSNGIDPLEGCRTGAQFHGIDRRRADARNYKVL